ncbi:hypothetical protein MWG58_28845 [Streptomyces sp. WAC00276]|uniref:hypothetical protein n=1 Tax=Streptomyces sp. WAC00276 TaxID=2933778 RepID=UPI001FFEEC43|nr:hypothetical protein [Streptomyces sp. WAC00276]MCK2144852.1 hypothetical protein [Streptomyces sp. WAC00276]
MSIYRFTDLEQDNISAELINDKRVGPVVWLQTTPSGCYVPIAQLNEVIAGVKGIASPNGQAVPAISPEIAAHVLAHFGHGGYEAGTFTRHLLSTMDTADPANLTRLGEAFPAYAAAVVGIKYDPEGVAFLQRLANGGIACTNCGNADGPFVSAGASPLCEPCHQERQ